MKQNDDGGYAPSYNLQFTVDTKQGVIVGVEVTQAGSDAEQLQPAMERLKNEAGQAPQQVLADSGYTSRKDVVAMAEAGIDLIGPAKDGEVQKETLYKLRGVSAEYRPEAFVFLEEQNQYRCPQGQFLRFHKQTDEVGRTKYVYTAKKQECAACAHKGQCCPKAKKRTLVRTEEGPEMVAFRRKMETEEAKQVYKKRGPVAEFPHACIKHRYGLRQFSVRGLIKVKLEALWVALSFNVQHWIRLCWKPKLIMAT
jgi:Transposase DDE domain